MPKQWGPPTNTCVPSCSSGGSIRMGNLLYCMGGTETSEHAEINVACLCSRFFSANGEHRTRYQDLLGSLPIKHLWYILSKCHEYLWFFLTGVL